MILICPLCNATFKEIDQTIEYQENYSNIDPCNSKISFMHETKWMEYPYHDFRLTVKDGILASHWFTFQPTSDDRDVSSSAHFSRYDYIRVDDIIFEGTYSQTNLEQIQEFINSKIKSYQTIKRKVSKLSHFQ